MAISKIAGPPISFEPPAPSASVLLYHVTSIQPNIPCQAPYQPCRFSCTGTTQPSPSGILCPILYRIRLHEQFSDTFASYPAPVRLYTSLGGLPTTKDADVDESAVSVNKPAPPAPTPVSTKETRRAARRAAKRAVKAEQTSSNATAETVSSPKDAPTEIYGDGCMLPPFDESPRPSGVAQYQPSGPCKGTTDHGFNRYFGDRKQTGHIYPKQSNGKPAAVKRYRKENWDNYLGKKRSSAEHEDDPELEFDDEIQSNIPNDFVKIVTVSKEIRISYSKNPDAETWTSSRDEGRVSEEAPSTSPSSPPQNQTQSLSKHDEPTKVTEQPPQHQTVAETPGQIPSPPSFRRRYFDQFSRRFPRRYPPPETPRPSQIPAKPTGPMSPLEEILDYKFTDPTLLKQAIRSEGHSAEESYILALLGDSILTQIVIEDAYELKMTRSKICETRVALTSNKNLAAHWRRLNLTRFINYSYPSPSSMATFMEALLGAVYIDSNKDRNVLRHSMTKLGLNKSIEGEDQSPVNQANGP